jgi:hypothetical protein
MRKPAWKGVHWLANRDGWNCAYCGELTTCQHCFPKAKGNFVATMDHVIPQIHGGTFAYANLKLACSRCNNLKGSVIIDEPITLEKIILYKAIADAEKEIRNAEVRARAAQKKQEKALATLVLA